MYNCTQNKINLSKLKGNYIMKHFNLLIMITILLSAFCFSSIEAGPRTRAILNKYAAKRAQRELIQAIKDSRCNCVCNREHVTEAPKPRIDLVEALGKVDSSSNGFDYYSYYSVYDSSTHVVKFEIIGIRDKFKFRPGVTYDGTPLDSWIKLEKNK